MLTGAGLLDRRETKAALQPDSLTWRADGIDLIGVAAIESWVRYWQTCAPDAPGAGLQPYVRVSTGRRSAFRMWRRRR